MRCKSWSVPDLIAFKQNSNGRHVNKGKMHRITIRLGPCRKLGLIKWGVPELKVDNIMFD